MPNEPLTGGYWRTTDDGRHIYIKNGKPAAGLGEQAGKGPLSHVVHEDGSVTTASGVKVDRAVLASTQKSAPKPEVKKPVVTRRPDGALVVDTPDGQAKTGVVKGASVRGEYHDYTGRHMTVTGKVIGFAHNKKGHYGGSTGDVAIHDTKTNTVYFVASRNVRRQR